jgi:PPE family protein
MGTNFNYDDTDHQVIFDRINGGAGSSSLQEVSRAWQRLGDDVGVTGKAYVQSAIRGILASREGAAADAAAAATGAMLPWMDHVALIAATASQRCRVKPTTGLPQSTPSRRSHRHRCQPASLVIPPNGSPRRWTGFRG